VEDETEYWWTFENSDGGAYQCQSSSTLDAAKHAAESAYRKLLAEHLEVVK
jgi:hypothetical protein